MDSGRDLDNERSELREDEKKLQIALQEYDEDWDFASDDDEDDDEEGRFLIDLEPESETAAQSLNSGTSSVGSASHTQRKSILVNDDVRTAGEQQQLLSSLPSTSCDVGDLSAGATSVAEPEKTLALNRALQGILEGHIEAIQEALERNKERQEHLEDGGSNTKKTIKLRTGRFRAPYFKIGPDYPEPNEDVVAKRQFAQFRTLGAQGFTKDLKYFHTRSKPTLRKHVLHDCLEQMIRPLMTKMEAEVERLDHAKSLVEEHECQLELEKPKLAATTDPAAKIDLKFRLAELEESIREQRAKLREHTKKISQLEESIAEAKNNGNESEILKTVDSEKVDWMRISKMNYSGNKSWIDCQKAWDHYISPNVATGMWTQEEKTRLQELVEKERWGPQAHADWAHVAKNLGTGRTAFQCLSAYQRSFNPEFRARPWTIQEEKRLVEEAHKVYDTVGFYHWRKVSALVENRSPYECMSRFAQVDPQQNRGKFTAEEDAKLLAAVEMYGLRWKEISRFVGTRNPVQVRDRYLVCLNPENNYLMFTYDEDLKLLKHVKEQGPSWSQLTQYFPGRSSSRLGTRFRQLERWKKKKEWFEAQPVGVKRVLLGKSLPMADRKNLETKIREYFVRHLGINLQDYKRQTLDKNNGVDPEIIPPRPPFIMHVSTVKSTLGMPRPKLWARKISQHKTLQESIERILTEEAKRREKSNVVEKLPAVVEEENDEELMNQAVSQSLENQEKSETAKPKKAKLKKMETLLAQAFHQGSSVHVSKILEVLSNPKMEEKPTRWQQKHKKADTVLKRFFRQETRDNFRPGRGRRMFDKDVRPIKVVEEEKAEVDRLVPSMCLKSMGSNLLQLYVSARRQHVLIQENLLNFPKAEDDPELMAQEARIYQTLEEITHQEAQEDAERPDLRQKCERRKLKIQKIFREKYSMERKKLAMAALSIQEDLASFHRHLGHTGALTKMPRGSLPIWLDNGEGSNPQDLPDMDLTLEEPLEPASEEVKKPGRRNRRGPNKFCILEAQKVLSKRPKAEENSEAKSAVRDPCVLSNSRTVHLFTEDELKEEERCLELLAPLESNISQDIPACLPCLPPNMTNLTTLKSLLLRRGELIRKSGPLTDLAKSGKIQPPTVLERGVGEQAPVKVDNAQENIILVDPEGKEIKVEDFADFIEEETQEEKSNKEAPHSPIVPLTISLEEDETEIIELGPVRKTKAETYQEAAEKGRTGAENLLASNPEYSVANFSANPESDDKSATVVEKGDEGGKSKSQYELVMHPSSRYHPSNVATEKKKQEKEDAYLSPKPIQRSGKTYADLFKKKQMKKSGEGPFSAYSGRSNAQFEFPNLTHTKNEVIKIDDESSESESGKDNDDDVNGVMDEKDTVKPADDSVSSSREPIRIVLASEQKYNTLVNRVQQQTQDQDVVVVDIADYDGDDNIVHFVKEKAGGFKAFESKSISRVENEKIKEPPGKVIQYAQTLSLMDSETLGSQESIRKERLLWRKLNLMPSVRQSQEYKMLRLRMQAMFLWPVLMSAVRPVTNPVLSQTIEDTMPEPQPTDRPRRGRPSKAKGRGRPPKEETKVERRTKRMRKEDYRRNQYMKKKRQERREAKLAAQAAAREGNADGFGGAVGGAGEGVVYSEPTRLEDVTLAFPPPPATAENGERGNVEDGTQGSGEQTKKCGQGRPSGRKYCKKVYPSAIERPKRKVAKRKTTEELAPRETRKRKAKEKNITEQTPEEQPEGTRHVPQWWKDAMLAAMMAKQMAGRAGRPGGDEVPIEEDEDFMDKGDYSDDEWVQDWNNRRRKETEGDLVVKSEEVEEREAAE